MNEITTIIQGPANTISLENLDNYRKFGPVIISCYDNEENNQILKIYDLKKDTLIKSINPYIKGCFNGGNSFLQTWTTLQGLQCTQTKYFVKVRSDEYWSDIEPVIKKIEDNPDSWTSCNIFFKGKPEPFHPSDHLFGGRVDYFKRALSFHRDICLFAKYPKHHHHLHSSLFNIPYDAYLLTEQALFLSFLWGKRVIHEIKEDNYAKMTYDNTELINIDDLGQYLWTCSIYNQKGRYNNSQKLYVTDQPSLKSKEEFWEQDYKWTPPGTKV